MRIVKNFHKNDSFEILCRKSTIPDRAPMLPPMKVKTSKNLSGILDFWFIANHLSIPYSKKANPLIANK